MLLLFLIIPKARHSFCFGKVKKLMLEDNRDGLYKFIELARNVYKLNDERAKIKLAINTTLGSNIKEVKSYE